MELKRKSLTARRAALLASTALIALLAACQGGTGTAGAPAATSSSDRGPGADHGDGGY